MAAETDSVIKKWVDDNGDWFERAVLWCATFDPATALRMQKVVCRDMKGEVTQDFSAPIYNSYYRIIRDFRESQVCGPITEQVAAMLAHSAPADILGPHEVELFANLYKELAAQPLDSLKDCVGHGLAYWLTKRRMSSVVTRSVSFRNWDATNVVGSLAGEIGFLNAALGATNHVSEFSSMLMTMKPEVVDCIPTNLVIYDRQLGGGFHRKDGHLVIAAPGIGKTVFALQVATAAALNGFHVAFITTEQPPEELVPRIVSNFCNIKFDRLVRGFSLSILDPKEQKRATGLAKDINKRLFFYDWGKTRKSAAAGGIVEEYNDCIERSGKCDMIVLDWIGGAITDEARSDKDAKRLAMQNTADAMAQAARDFNIATLCMAQAHKTTGTNNACVSVTDCTDCKTLDQKMTVVSGLTGMFNSAAKGAIAEGHDPSAMGLFEDKQYIFTSKARKSSGGHAPFRRMFGYQRLEDWS